MIHYFITSYPHRWSPSQQVEFALGKGIRWIQLRMKKAPLHEIESEIQKIVALKKKFEFTFIVNDFPNLAKIFNADGCHVGKNDIHPYYVRKMLGEDAIVGFTVNHAADLTDEIAGIINYIGLGPFAYTKTKENLSPVLGEEGIREILSLHKNLFEKYHLKVFVIGGIQKKDWSVIENIPGVDGMAYSSALLNESDNYLIK
ncbi:MAG: thiamine-phosphate synthase [Bacteroidia bacterium]|nr:MAG: thiamine-phosphate synthase [Bacteroidia bacterium]